MNSKPVSWQAFKNSKRFIWIVSIGFHCSKHTLWFGGLSGNHGNDRPIASAASSPAYRSRTSERNSPVPRSVTILHLSFIISKPSNR